MYSTDGYNLRSDCIQFVSPLFDCNEYTEICKITALITKNNSCIAKSHLAHSHYYSDQRTPCLLTVM